MRILVMGSRLTLQFLLSFLAGYALAIKFYVPPSSTTTTEKADRLLLPRERVERVVLDVAMEVFDGASNGNKTRGGVKRANETYAFLPTPFYPNHPPISTY